MQFASTSPLGLTTKEAERLLEIHGSNSLPENRGPSVYQQFAKQFKSPLIYVLLFALFVDLGIWILEGASGWPIESLAIGFMLLLNAGLGTYQENKAEAALAKLKAMSGAKVWALRNGVYTRILAEQLVPTDIVRIEAGDRIPADGVLHEGQGVLIDESALTGESLPVEKSIADKLFSGTLIIRGKCYVRVEGTGVHSNMGKLADLLGNLVDEKTPLEKRMQKLGNQIAVAIFVLALFLVVGGIFVEGVDSLDHIFLFAVVVAVAAIPEGLPAVLTLALALGVERMAAKKAVVRRLSAVESLGSVTVIATDKTGTLTENRMMVKSIDCTDRENFLQAVILANDAELETGAGDPLELGLLEFAHSDGADIARITAASPRQETMPFDSAYRYMRVTVQNPQGTVRYLKGAPETIIERSNLSHEERDMWERKILVNSARGYRVLAVAMSTNGTDENVDFLGLALMWDPPRPEVADALSKAQDAGIRVVMITGDHPETARAIAKTVGITGKNVMTGAQTAALSFEDLKDALGSTNIFARAAPEHKLRLIEALKSNGEVVAVTGDGVNDAPALKRADVGIAMGQRGSDVSREVADIVLLDDNFATIVSAIEEGRSIYENIQKFIRFLFSTNFGLVVLIIGGLFVAYFLGLKEISGELLLPLTALQLLWVNIISDGPAAMALALDRNPGVMNQKPRDPSASLLNKSAMRFILLSGFTKAGFSLSLLLVLPILGYGAVLSRTAVFLYDSIAELLFAFPARRISGRPKRNLWLNYAIFGGITLQILTAFVPQLRELLGLEQIDLLVGGIITASILLSWGLTTLIGRVK